MVEGEDQATLTARQMAQVQSIVNEMNPDWSIRLPLLGDLLDLPIPDNATTAAFDAQLRQEALFALAVDLVQAWAQDQALLLLVDDAHWMDEASVELTLALARNIANIPLLLALVHRPPIRADEPLLPQLDQWPYCYRLDLSDLSPQGVAALATNRLQGGISSLALDVIQTLAHGNPFFIEELVDNLRETARLVPQSNGIWTLSEAMVNTLHEANCLIRKEEGWQVAFRGATVSRRVRHP